jgi:2-polyprenyl-3-methyl-5-hydroxy-6-metoxy-1,4-benzoquinol methylase
MNPPKTREPQYQSLIEQRDEDLERFGIMSSAIWRDDPRRLCFVLARYKFVAKMLSGMKRVLEVGCADAFGTRIVRQEVETVFAVDFDHEFIARNRNHIKPWWRLHFMEHDMTKNSLRLEFEAVYAVDVIEHIPKEHEDQFVKNLAHSVIDEGVCLVGTPSLESQKYASEGSKAGHVNCKSAENLRLLMRTQFHNVFLFSMNDEVVHTGFYPMANYLWALCCNKRFR